MEIDEVLNELRTLKIQIEREAEFIKGLQAKIDRLCLNSQLTETNIRKPRKDNDLLSDEELLSRLKRIIVEEQLYLRPKVSLRDVSDSMDVSQVRLKQMFAAAGASVSLNSLICRQRVEAACELLHTHPHYSMRAIAYESGFQSMKTFYRWFADIVGCSPTSYIEAADTTNQQHDDAT